MAVLFISGCASTGGDVGSGNSATTSWKLNTQQNWQKVTVILEKEGAGPGVKTTREDTASVKEARKREGD